MLRLSFYRTKAGNSPVEDYIREQAAEARARILETLRAFCEEFPAVVSVSIKPLRSKMWEIRISDERRQQHRLLYVVLTAELVVLHAFTKKTAKTPDKELQLGIRRMKDIFS